MTVETVTQFKYVRPKWILGTLVVFFLVQMAVPFRHVLYPSELFWVEEGYRFSWRVMLMEKIGYTNFKVVILVGSSLCGAVPVRSGASCDQALPLSVSDTATVQMMTPKAILFTTSAML